MSEQAILEKIIADAEEEAQAIISAAEREAEATVAQAEERANLRKQGEERAVAEKVKSIYDGKAAIARLDSAKILLGEKRVVIDGIYARALEAMKKMSKTDALYLSDHLLDSYAEEGDEIVFDTDFAFVKDVAALDCVKQKKLKISSKKADVGGGFVLSGKTSDKNLSYAALLQAVREVNQAAIAARIFATD